MERSALYRRAVAPLHLLAGGVGIAAAGSAAALGLDSPRSAVFFWLFTGLVVGSCALAVVRRQALSEGEPFWTPPARRVFQAVFPGFAAGALLAVPTLADRPMGQNLADLIPAAWMILYGISMHASGFFLPHGPRRLAWIFLLAGLGLGLAQGFSIWTPRPVDFHWSMGATFGLFHLLSGLGLNLAERQRDAIDR